MGRAILLYGANGFTGKLIIKELVNRKINFTVAGRNENEIKALGEAYNVDYRIFDLNDHQNICRHIASHKLVIHAAGPFIYTAEPMIKACIDQGVHYIDITGEIQVFELAKSLGKAAAERGVLLLPGAGFDVVPTDCAGLMAKEALEEAQSLEIAFYQKGGQISRGTMKTSVLGMADKGRVRKDGQLTAENTGKRSKVIEFDHQLKRHVMSIPWGDVSTAHHTTGIPNIVAYMAVHPRTIRLVKFQSLLRPLFRIKWLRNWMLKKIDDRPPGPDQSTMETASTYIYARAVDRNGRSACIRLKCQEAYSLTSFFAAYIAEQVLQDSFTPGFQTPAGMFGSQLIFELKTTQKIEGLTCD